MTNSGKRPEPEKINRHMRQAAENSRQGQLRSGREQAVFLFILIAFVVVSIFVDRGNAVSGKGGGIPAHAGWRMEAGEDVDLSEMPMGVLDLSMDISALDLDCKSLCLKSVDTMFDVYADGRQIYSYHPVIPKRLGPSYGMYVHTVPIPGSTTTLGLRLVERGEFRDPEDTGGGTTESIDNIRK